MEAKQDVIVEDSAGLLRKLFAGQRVPNELVDAYEEAIGEEKTKAQKGPAKHKAELAPEKDKAQSGPDVKKSRRRTS